MGDLHRDAANAANIADVITPSLKRRRLLQAITGGALLAASGLVLPAWLEEVEAREGSLDGAKGGRRRKDRKGRQRQRTHGDKKDEGKRGQDAPKGQDSAFRAAALTVYNNLSDTSLQCTFYYRIKTGLDDYSLPVAHSTHTIKAKESLRYDPNRYRVGVLIKQILGANDLYADVRNLSLWFPQGEVTKGTQLDPPNGIFGADVIPEQGFGDGKYLQAENIGLERRKDDSQGAYRIEWLLTVGTDEE